MWTGLALLLGIFIGAAGMFVAIVAATILSDPFETLEGP